jgi:tRNA1(Val) A37 N6-methylase TrmN6
MSPAFDIEAAPDRFLGGRLSLLQPVEGYRAAMDPVLLAAAVPALARGRVLDLGCGIGTALFCYGARVPGPDLAGLEIDPAMADLARRNAAENGFAERCTIRTGDVAAPPAAFAAGSFDQVFANPPYLEAESGSPSPLPGRARANVEGTADLKTWVAAALRLVRPKGGLSFIHRADRIDRLIALLAGKAGEITVIPLWPRAGEPAKRAIIRARKGVRGGAVLHPGLVLHGPADAADARYTPEAAAILRDGAPL